MVKLPECVGSIPSCYVVKLGTMLVRIQLSTLKKSSVA